MRIILFIIILFGLPACERDSKPLTRLNGNTMGTTWSVKISQPLSVSSSQLSAEIQSRLDTLNRTFSTYDPRSLISEFNAHNSTNPFQVNHDFFVVTQHSKDIFQLSNGLFDPTLAPLIELWGFGSQTTFNIPSSTQINKRRSLIGLENLTINPTDYSIRKQLSTLSLDFSAIAKGYAVDEIAELLNQKNIKHFLVEIGGEIKAQGKNGHGESWSIGIAHPTNSLPITLVALDNEGMATSGNYRNFFFHEGQRYSHTLNPKTGYPIKDSMSSVTIIADSTMRADALATAIMTMGKDDGLTFANRHNIKALIIDSKENAFQTYSSQAMKEHEP